MIKVHPEYIVDEEPNKRAVVIPYTEWVSLIEEVEELDDIRAYDAAKSEKGECIPFEQAINEIKSGTVK